MSNELKSAIQAARAVTALIPKIKIVKFLRTYPGSTQEAHEVFSAAAVAAWQMAVIIRVRVEMEKDTEDCKINWEESVKLAKSERGLQHLENMTQYHEWMAFDLSQEAHDAIDGDNW